MNANGETPCSILLMAKLANCLRNPSIHLGNLPNICRLRLRLNGQLTERKLMEQALNTLSTDKWSANGDQFDRDIQLTRALDVLKKENGELRQLVVKLSETILRNVTANVGRPSLFTSTPATPPPG